MSKIQVKFVKEVEADLNAYYESFPKSLRTQIDDALYALLGGQKPKRRSPREAPRNTKVGGTTVFRLGTTPIRIGSKVSNVFADLRRLNGGDVVKKEEVEKIAVQHGLKKSNVLNNMVRNGYLVGIN